MTQKKIGIYKITSPSGKVYIGQSEDIHERWKDYQYSIIKGQVRIYKSICKHGVENHVFEIMEECEITQLNNRERFWQDYYDVIGENGLNCILIESDEKPRVVSEETRKKLSEANKGMNSPNFGVPWSEEIRKKTMEGRNYTSWSAGKTFSEEYRKKLSESFKKYYSENPGNRLGINHTPESKEKMSKSKKGKNTGENNPASKLILNLETGIYYSGATEAAESCGMNKNILRSYLNGNRRNKSPFIRV